MSPSLRIFCMTSSRRARLVDARPLALRLESPGDLDRERDLGTGGDEDSVQLAVTCRLGPAREDQARCPFDPCQGEVGASRHLDVAAQQPRKRPCDGQAQTRSAISERCARNFSGVSILPVK